MIYNGLPPVHPGEFLAEILTELDISQAQFARAVGISPMRVSHIIRGTRPVTAELALLFGRALGQSPQYWLNLQEAYDLKTAETAINERLEAVTVLVTAPKRSEIIASAPAAYARKPEVANVIREKAGACADEDHPEFATLEDATRWREDNRSQWRSTPVDDQEPDND